MSKITTRTKAEEVRKALGYGWQEWGIFNKTTSSKAKDFVAANHTHLTSWSDVKRATYLRLLGDVNEELQQENLQPISEDIFKWKFGQLVPPLIKEHRKESREQDTQTPTVNTSQSGDEEDEGPSKANKPSSFSSRPGMSPSISNLVSPDNSTSRSSDI